MIHARGLVKRFGDLVAVDGIDLDVKRGEAFGFLDRKSTRLNSSHTVMSYAVFCLKKKNEAACDRLERHSREFVTAQRVLAARLVEIYNADSPDPLTVILSSFFFDDTPTTENYTLPIHDALPN